MGDYNLREIGDRVSSLIKEMRITQDKVAENIGIHPSSLSYIVRGKRMPNSQKIANLSRYLRSTPDYILNGVEPRLYDWDNIEGNNLFPSGPFK